MAQKLFYKLVLWLNCFLKIFLCLNLFIQIGPKSDFLLPFLQMLVVEILEAIKVFHQPNLSTVANLIRHLNLHLQEDKGWGGTKLWTGQSGWHLTPLVLELQKIVWNAFYEAINVHFLCRAMIGLKWLRYWIHLSKC